MNAPNYRRIARLLSAQENCQKNGNEDWYCRHGESIENIMKTAPSGSGIDNGTYLSDGSTPERLVFTFGYHHIDQNGYYDSWTEHTVVVTPSLQFGTNIRVTGRDRNGLKDYLTDVFATWINSDTKF